MDIATVVKVNPDEKPKRTLSAWDRCDSCGAQAYVRYATLFGELLFCKHHGDKNHDALIAGGAAVSEDDRPVLIAEESGMN